MTDNRITVLQRDADGRPTSVAYRLRYVTRYLHVGMELEATAPSDRGRRIIIERFTADDTSVWPRRNTSRRGQAISIRTVVCRYAPTGGGWSRDNQRRG